MNERIVHLLNRSFDDQLTEQEQSALTKALSQSSELREEKRRIEDVRKAVAENAERSFKPFFAARVMRRIEGQEQSSEDFVGALAWAFRRFALGGTIAILLLIAQNLILQGNRSLDAMLDLPQLTLEDTLQLDDFVEELIP